jgi:glycosyltransferase involved in cell wall biosynthesis
MVWGSSPILNNKYWSLSMKQGGFHSETFVKNYLGQINKKEDWDNILTDKYTVLPLYIKRYIAFWHCLFRYDVFFISFDGFFIGQTIIWRIQAPILKLAGKKVVVLPFGSDSYVYRNIRSTALIHGLMMSYPVASRKQEKVENQVKYWTKNADLVIPSFMGMDGFGRWDVLTPSTLVIDTDQWLPTARKNLSKGNSGSEPVIIAHTPNHRGFKGTEFIVHAVEELQSEGYNIELRLIENMQNDEVRRVLQTEVDILIEQLIATGYALSGIEGMACGLPVISNLEDESYTLPLKRWSFLGECSIVSATPETVKDKLRMLITDPELRLELGRKSRDYVTKYHSLEASRFLFKNVLDYLYGRKKQLINLYHPLLSQDKSSNT